MARTGLLLVSLLLVVTTSGAGRVMAADTDGGSARVPIADSRRIPMTYGPPKALDGTLTIARKPAAGWSVDLYAASPTGATHLDSTTSDGDGKFRFDRRSTWKNVLLYILARRGTEDRMLALLGENGDVPQRVVVNELSTIASVWAAAQFLQGDAIRGNAIGLHTAARNVPNLVDLSTGELGAVVQDMMNGTRTTTQATFNTLASILSDCLRHGCPAFFTAATLPGETPPTTTLDAFGNVARNPWHKIREIFALRPPANPDHPELYPTFLPTLLWEPTAWTLALVYGEGGFQAPGGISIDAYGNIWTNNNFMPGSQAVLAAPGGMGVTTYSGIGVTKLTSNGEPLSPRTGFIGGGTFGGAFGVAIDRDGHAWIGNFAGNSLTELGPDGTPISPSSMPQYGLSGGWTTKPTLESPQSIIFDQSGDLWVTNLGGHTVTRLIGGDHRHTRTYGGKDCLHKFRTPWGLASDGQGRIWVSNFATNSVSMIDPAATTTPPFCPTAHFDLLDDGFLSQPEGVAVDSHGNVWVAKLEADKIALLDAATGFSVTEFDGGGSVDGPWGMAVDGADNVWSANFWGKRLIHLCGKSGNCPQGRQPGDPISPSGDGGGYGGNGALQSLTAVKVDQAGNVWVANNFDDPAVCLLGAGLPPPLGPNTVELERLQTQCGGNGVVQFLGIAAPTKAPVVGPAAPPD